MTQLTLNAKISNMTKTTPFFANFGREPNLFETSRNQVSIEATMKKGNTIKMIQDVTSTPRRDKKHHSAAYLRYQASARGAQGIEQIEQKDARGAQRIEQIEQVNAQDAQGTKWVEQLRDFSCI